MNEQVTSDPTTTDGRKNNGTFAAGNQFGRGNPFARKVAAFRAALMEAVSEQDIKDIACKLRDRRRAPRERTCHLRAIRYTGEKIHDLSPGERASCTPVSCSPLSP
jgi:hypothetical protein